MTIDYATLAAILFGLFIAGTLFLVVRANRESKQSADFYNAGGSLSGFQNGLAISADYMSAASFLGIAGLISLFGFDGFLYSIGFLVAWLLALLLIAEPLRNTGRYTMGDVVSFRMSQKPVRTAAAASTLLLASSTFLRKWLVQELSWLCSWASPIQWLRTGSSPALVP
jgi:cation/acetate symporter